MVVLIPSSTTWLSPPPRGQGTLSRVRRSTTWQLSRLCNAVTKFQGRANSTEQGFRSERLVQEVHCPSFERLFPGPLIRAGGDKNDRNAITGTRQTTLQLKSTHAWHMHVNNKARHVAQAAEKQEFFARSEDLNGKAERFDQSSRCLADRSIIVYHREHSSFWQLALHCSAAKVAPGVIRIHCALV